MPIDRKNSFHLLLSDDELRLLRLLAEREGLNASDYLRSILRREAGTPPHLRQVIQLGSLLGGERVGRALEAYRAGATKKRVRKKAH
ncbi:MAG TPA: hypothetical protein VHE30_25585 [Polyangiaceae bacterium]|nr:hypothetical protein [Polyangiaceae bacterium]